MVLYKQTALPDGRDQNYNLNHALLLGITQCVIGALCFILDLFGLGLLDTQHFFVGGGIWCGIVFFITGVLGIIASKFKTKVTIVSFLGFSLASALLAIVLLVLKSLCIASNYRSYLRSDNANVVFSIVLLVLALTECTMAAISIVLCAKAIYRAQFDMSITKSTEAGTDNSMDPHSQPAAPSGDWRQIKLKFLIPGIMQCVIGIICFVEDLVLRGLVHLGYTWIPEACTTVWCGLLFIICGVIGILASLRKSKCSIDLFLVTSVTGALSAIVLVVIKSINVAKNGGGDWVRERFLDMDISLVALGVVELIVAIISAIICGLALRKKKRNECISEQVREQQLKFGDSCEHGGSLSGSLRLTVLSEKTALLLTVPQCAVGLTCIITGSVRLGLYGNQPSFVASEIWCGIPFIVAGVSGVIACKKKMKYTLLVFLVTSILAAFCGCTLIAMKIVGAATNNLAYHWDKRNLALDVSVMLAGLTQLVLSCVSVLACCIQLKTGHTEVDTHTASNGLHKNEGDQILTAPSCVYSNNFARGCALKISILQIVAGAICIVCDIIGILYLDSQKIFVASGIWCGVIFIAAGVIGIVASKNTSKCTIVAFLVFAVLASLCAVVLLSIKSVSAHQFITHIDSWHQERILAMNVALIVVALGEGAASVSLVFICGAGLYKINSRKTTFPDPAVGVFVSPASGESAHHQLATESSNKALPFGELRNYSDRSFAHLHLGAALCVLGIFCIIVDLNGIAFYDRHNPTYASGIWCGIIFIITGVIGVFASKKKCAKTVTALMVMSIISTLFAVTFLVLKCISAAKYERGSWYQIGQLTMRVVSIVLALATGAVTIASTVICCVAIYRNNKRRPGAADSLDVFISGNACTPGSGTVSLSSARRTGGKGRDVPNEHTDGAIGASGDFPVSIRARARTRKPEIIISRTVLFLGITQCAIGIVCFTLDVIFINILFYRHRAFSLSSGIWCGVMFVVAGTLAICSAQMKTRCMVTSSVVASYVTMVFAVALIAIKIASAVINARLRVYPHVALSVGLLVFAVAELIIAALTAYLSLVELRGKKAEANQPLITRDDHPPLQGIGIDLSETDQKITPEIVSNIPTHGSTDQKSKDADNMADSVSQNSAQNDGKMVQRGNDGDQMITHM